MRLVDLPASCSASSMSLVVTAEVLWEPMEVDSKTGGSPACHWGNVYLEKPTQRSYTKHLNTAGGGFLQPLLSLVGPLSTYQISLMRFYFL